MQREKEPREKKERHFAEASCGNVLLEENWVTRVRRDECMSRVYRKLRNNSYVMRATSSLVFAVSRVVEYLSCTGQSKNHHARARARGTREKAAFVSRTRGFSCSPRGGEQKLRREGEFRR